MYLNVYMHSYFKANFVYIMYIDTHTLKTTTNKKKKKKKKNNNKCTKNIFTYYMN